MTDKDIADVISDVGKKQNETLILTPNDWLKLGGTYIYQTVFVDNNKKILIRLDTLAKLLYDGPGYEDKSLMTFIKE